MAMLAVPALVAGGTAFWGVAWRGVAGERSGWRGAGVGPAATLAFGFQTLSKAA